jgi:hypothetical protein
MRSIWIANLALKSKDCFETRLCLADCLLEQLLFDAAFKEYNKALTYEPDNDQAKKGLIISSSFIEKLDI